MRNKLKKHSYGIIGLGEFGFSLATSLADSGIEIVALDKDHDKVREIRDYTDNAFIVDSLDKSVLEETGLKNCDVVVVCIGQSIEQSILVTLNLISLGVPSVISRAISKEHGEILRRLGAKVVYPEVDMAERLAKRLENDKALDFIALSKKISVTKVVAPEGIYGRSILDVDFRKRFGLNIIAIENESGVMDTVDPNYTIVEGDVFYFAGKADSIEKMLDWIETK